MNFNAAQLDSVLSDIGADAAKTGMLSTPEVVHLVAAKFREYQVAKLVVDPVMIGKSGDALLKEEAIGALIHDLLPLALLVTPTLPEAQVIIGQPVKTLADMAAAARKIQAMGPKSVLVKGGHLDRPAVDLLFGG